MIPFFSALVIFIVVALVIYNTKMVTEVSQEKKIAMTFFPFTFSPNVIPLIDVKEMKIVNYQPHKDYGGLGIRYNSKGKAYIMGGSNTGVLLIFKDSQKKPVLIGSQKTDEFYVTLQSLMSK